MHCCHSPSRLDVSNLDYRKVALLYLTSVEDETINTNLLVPRNADPVDETLLVPESTQGSHKPAVSITSLSYIIGRSAADIELGLLEYLL